MEDGQRVTTNPQAVLTALYNKREKLHEELRMVEKQVYDLETTYLQDSSQCGNVLKGFEGFLSSTKNTANLKRSRKFQPEDRLFSLSSVTSPAVEEHAVARDDVATPERNDNRRVKNEELIIANQIRNIIVDKGKARIFRHVTTDIRRVYFNEAGFTEMNFSFQGLYQARLLLEEYVSGKFFTLELDGHTIIVKWKGTPLITLSAWSVAKNLLVEGK